MTISGRFANKVVVITGGSSGIGRAAAIAFAREGASVAIAARGLDRGESVVQEITGSGGTGMFVQTDVAEPEQIQRLFEKVIERFGRIDCAFNNAATVPYSEILPTADLTEEQFDSSIGSNLKSVWLCMKHEIRQMTAQQPSGGTIVNTSSVNGLGGARNSSLYSAAKAGILALTKCAAMEYASAGIRVNARVAGGFRTPLLEGLIDHFSAGDAAVREKIEHRYKSMVILGRLGEPEEAAQTVLWLCSDAASYVTGNSMIVDGGWTAAYR